MLDGRDASAAHTVGAKFIISRLAATALFVGSAAASGAPRFHLRGIARIDAHVARAQGKLVLSGTITDDMGAPVQHARVAVRIETESLDANARPALLPMAPTEAEACTDAWQAPSLDGTDRLLATTDGAARFCLRLALPTGRYVAQLEASGGGFVDGARTELPVDLALEPVTLRFDPERAALSLDDESSAIEVVASSEDDEVVVAAANLPLSLSNESGRVLGSATTDGSGRARFVVPGALFGPAGSGELRVSFAGSAEAGASAHAMAVERRTHVDLTAPEATGGRLPLASAEREVGLHVVATAMCAPRGCAGIPTGTIEARLGDGDTSRIVGAAPLARGEARVVVTLPAPGEGSGDAALRLDYVPDAPWFESTGPLRLTQPLHPRGAWDKVALALTALGVVGWLILGRLPRRRSDRERPSGGVPAAESVASIELLSPAVAGAQRWTGRIVDRHEGTPVAGARVAIERPGFDRMEVVADATSDSDGAFVLSPATAQPGDLLVAEGTFHAVAKVPAPAFGDIRVALVSRRRALLDRLVEWARRRGRPFDAKPEPTPGHVQRMARSGGEVQVWAQAVERAAYSGATVDAGSEAEVDRLAPGDPPPARGAAKT